MKIFVFYCICIISITSCRQSSTPLANYCGLEPVPDTTFQYFKVLFIGNSHTSRYDIPETIELIAKSKGDSIAFEMSAPGGYDFKGHYKLISTISAIKSQKWDYAVLQESGWRTAFTHSITDTMIFPYADSLKRLIKNNNNLTEIILFMTHGYKNGVLTFNDDEWCELDPQVCTYQGMQDRIKDTYLELSSGLDAEIAPAGMIWKIFMERYPQINLFQPDGVHANQFGSYLSACTIYCIISRKKPDNIYVPGNVTLDIAEKIQNLVLNVLFECDPDWMKN